LDYSNLSFPGVAIDGKTFRIDLNETHGHYYAMYWPEEVATRNESLDPHAFASCERAGGRQKLRTRTIELPSDETKGTIFLYRCDSFL
jgi:hypothetical protein